MNTPAVYLWIAHVPATPPSLAKIWEILPQNQDNQAYVAHLCRDTQPTAVIAQRLTALLAFLQALHTTAPDLCPHVHLHRKESGQPYVTWEGMTPPPMAFSLSHTKKIGMCGLAFGIDSLGVDLEHTIPTVTAEKISRRYFAGDELAWLAQGTHPTATSVTHLWTAKEALFKCGGYDALLATNLTQAAGRYFWVGDIPAQDAAVCICTPTATPTPILLATPSPVTWL